MDINQLIRFQAAAKYGNLTKAAEDLYISQSALSKSIQQLESELHIQLFDRFGKTITLNPSGEIVLKYTEQITKLLDAMEQALDAANDPSDPVLTIATIRPVIANHLFPKINLQHPELRLNTKFVRIAKEEAIRLLTLGTFDLFISNYPIDDHDEIRSILHSEEKICLSVVNESEFATRDVIRKEDLAGLTLPATQYSFDTLLGPLAEELRTQGIKFNIFMTDDIAGVKYLQKISDLPSVTTDVAWSFDKIPGRTIKEIQGVPPRKNYLHFLKKSTKRVQRVVKLLMTEYKNFSDNSL